MSSSDMSSYFSVLSQLIGQVHHVVRLPHFVECITDVVEAVLVIVREFIWHRAFQNGTFILTEIFNWV